MAGLRVVMRGMTFLRLAILARILTPYDFGLFGIASIVLAFLEILTETGVNVFLIQERKDIDKYINSSWVVSIFRGVIISTIIIFSASLVSTFFNSPDSKVLILLIALVPIIRGFINPAIVKFQSEMKFNKEFWFRSSIFMIDSLVAISISYHLKSSVGIIIGVIAGSVFEVIFSYLFTKPIPKYEFEAVKLKKVIGKGKWITFAGIFNYLAEHVDDAAVGKIISVEALGLYQNAYKISTLPLTEITQVAGKVTFPALSEINEDKIKLKAAFIKISFWLFILILISGSLVFLFPDLVINILLGPNWLSAKEVLQILAIFGMIRSTSGLANSLFLSINKQNYVASITFIQFITLGFIILPFINSFGMIGAGYASIAASIVPIPLVLYYLHKVFK